jgi:segregation and condensation protein B
MMQERNAILEAMIFAAETPLTIEKIEEIFPDWQRNEIVASLQDLVREYDKRQGGICIQEVAGGFRFQTTIEMAPWIGKLKAVRPLSLSPSAMETLAVVAYRQPVVKADIDRIRGVDTGGVLRGLMEKKLLRIVGRKDVPGKPIIYGTTRKFLEIFNLKSLAELPTLTEMKDLQPSDLADRSGLDF